MARKVDIRAERIANIQVTGDIIGHSVRGDSQRCMIRNAVGNAVPDAKRIEVDLQYVRFTRGDGYRRKYPLPAQAAYNLASFEAGDPIEPFQFTLRGGAVYDSTQGESKPGTPAAIRVWAVENGLLPAGAPARKTRITASIRKAYTEATGFPVLGQKQGRQRTMTRHARTSIRGDRFYGLRLADGFQPGGAVKENPGGSE